MIEGLEHLFSIRIAYHYSDTSQRKATVLKVKTQV